ncbi:MAG: imidazole glycerol phosphate synthase subunit HisH [Slackia sp.]|nr:imidazole glycerol phosphate synthase subunit HisH [Slackia sp.]
MAGIVVVDYHKGNLMSVERGLKAAGADVRISDDPCVIAAADAAVLPGVGSFAAAASFMAASGQSDAVLRVIEAERPFLGICLGMQLLFERGEEGAPEGGTVAGLGVLKGSCVRLDAAGLKVPHVGWDDVSMTDHAGPLFDGVPDGAHFYFTHSYVVRPENADAVSCSCSYGSEFPAAVASGSVFGCQFHPEKSSHRGRQVLRNFVDIVEGSRRKGAAR